MKEVPNDHEMGLFSRTHHYAPLIANIRGIQMVAVVNSLSMYATRTDSDIDLCIVTKPWMLWYVRFFVTLTLWRHGVWRKNSDIAGNFCLSFFFTENAMNMQKIALSNDVYLYFWTYFLKPIVDYDETYEKFLQENSWVDLDENQKQENERWRQIRGSSRRIFFWHYWMNNAIRFFLRRKTLKNYEILWKPEGIIISDDMLKFHDKDQRKYIRDHFLQEEYYPKNTLFSKKVWQE